MIMTLKQLLSHALFGLGCAAFAVWAFYMGLTAIEREQEAMDEIRAERCARWGESLPTEYQVYCDNLGV